MRPIETDQELDELRKQVIKKNQEEQRKIREAARTYYQRKLAGTPVSVRSIAIEFKVSWWSLKKVVGGTEHLHQEGEN